MDRVKHNPLLQNRNRHPRGGCSSTWQSSLNTLKAIVFDSVFWIATSRLCLSSCVTIIFKINHLLLYLNIIQVKDKIPMLK